MPLDNAKSLVRLALAGHVASVLAIIFGYQATGSSALLALAILGLVVVAHHAVLLSGLGEAAGQADARHPFGHGRELYFWSFVAGVLLFAHGAGVAIFEGIAKLKAPVFVSLGATAQIMLFVALVVQAAIAYAWTTARPGHDAEDHTLTGLRDPVRTAVAIDNVAVTLAVLVALAGLNTAEHSGIRAGDAVAALAIGFVMAAVAAFMCVRTKAVLIGQAATPSMRAALRSLIQAEAGPGHPIATVHEIKTLELGGGDLLVAADVRFRPDETARTVAETAARLQASVAAEIPEVSHFYMSVAPEPASADAGTPVADALGDAVSNHVDANDREPPHAGGSHKGGGKKRRH